MFESEVRSAGDLAGVFEYDGEVAYFYLYDLASDEGRRIAASIHILSAEPDFVETDLAIRWDAAEELVGLLIRGKAWAAFHAPSRTKFGGDYTQGAESLVPTEIATRVGG